jgi:glutamate-1-semialdehyde 2,1-aminomutase
VRAASSIEARYLARTPRSRELTARAERVMPAGETRSVYHPPYSLTLDRGQGARCYDVDGNEYLDLSNNYTVLVHGHAFPPVVEAVKRQVEKGSTWAAKAVSQTELAELLVERFAGVDKVRFANTGTEAVLAAVAIARACTGRRKLLLSRYSYHGHLLEPSSKHGELLPEDDLSGSWLECRLARFGDAKDFEAVLAQHGSEIAAVMLEPILAMGGCVTAPPEFFERVKAAAHRAGALFIFDEATVHRISTGGAQKRLGVVPDLAVLGKLVGGGFPCGAVGGSDEVMKVLDPRTGHCFLSGSFTGNPVSMVAGVQAVRHFTDDCVARMERQMAAIEQGVTRSARRHGLPFSTRRVGNLMQMYFSPKPPIVTQLREDQELVDRFQLACLINGLFIVSRIVINTSSAATDADIEEIIGRLDRALADTAAES